MNNHLEVLVNSLRCISWPMLKRTSLASVPFDDFVGSNENASSAALVADSSTTAEPVICSTRDPARPAPQITIASTANAFLKEFLSRIPFNHGRYVSDSSVSGYPWLFKSGA